MSSPIYQAPTPSMGRGDGLGLQRRREEQEAKRQLQYALYTQPKYDYSQFYVPKGAWLWALRC